MSSCRFGLLGHGVGGSLFARLLRAGGAEVVSYDVLLEDAAASDKMRRKIEADGARRAGVLDEVWDEIRETFAPDRMERTLETWIRSHAVSSGRRYHEMIEGARLLEELRVPPVVAGAAAEVFRRSDELGIAAAFDREPQRFTDVIDFIDRRLPPRD